MDNIRENNIKTNDIDTSLLKQLLKVFILTIILCKVGYEISFVSNPDDSWFVVLQKNALTLLIFLFLLGYISSYTIGECRDKMVTAIILIILYSIFRYSYWLLTGFFELSNNNPLVTGYFIFLASISLMVLLSRFTKLNLVKSMGWIFGLGIVGFFFLTFSIYGTLEVCRTEEESGIKDPLQTVLQIYFAWFLLIILLFWVDSKEWNWGSLRKDPKKCSLRYTLILIFLIGGGLLWYTWKRCKGADKSSEETAIEQEPTWVNTSAHIATIMAWLNAFIGHNFSSTFLGFMSFGILDRCAPKNDMRKTAISSLLIIVLPIIYLINIINKSK
jgi:hypothetical protein